MSSEEIDEISLGESEPEFSGFGSEDLDSNPPTLKLLRSRNSKAVVDTECADKTTGNSSRKTGKTAKETRSLGERPGASKTPKTDVKSAKTTGKTKKTLKSVVNKVNTKCSVETPFDFSKMSESNLLQLKQALGLVQDPEYSAVPLQQPLRELPNIHVSVDRDDLVGDDVVLDYNNNDYADLGDDFGAALFEENVHGDAEGVDEFDIWQQPKVKAPERGPAVASNLANLINTACTVQCDTEPIVSKYKIPQNCTSLGAPSVNSQIFKIMNPRARSQDSGIAEVQDLLSTGIVPVIKLADSLKSHIQENKEAKTLLSDIMTIIGQSQYMLSVRRRYMIRPHLNRKYSNLCSRNTPITNQLFGDDVSKEIKSCDTEVYLGKNSFAYRGRGYTTRPMRGRRAAYSGNFDQSYQRHAPYPRRGYYRGQNARLFGQRSRRAPSATVTSEYAKN